MKRVARISLQAAAATVLAAIGQTAAANYVGDNHSWVVTCNSSGYVLTSKHPVSRFVEAGMNSRTTEEIESIYLGTGCDAEHKLFGKGKWCWANGGFQAEFTDHSIGFPRQELICPGKDYEVTGCGC